MKLIDRRLGHDDIIKLWVYSCLIFALIFLTLPFSTSAQFAYRWSWQSGSDTEDQISSFGTKGVTSSSTVPGSRTDAVSWTGPDGYLWMMGGQQYDALGNYDFGNDVWRYNPSSGNWTWMSGSEKLGQNGNYGTKGVSSTSNMPGGRYSAAAWNGPDGNLWLMGGRGYDKSSSITGKLNDLWKYNPSTGEWTWMSGSDTENQAGNYGSKGVTSVSNVPGARSGAVSWTGPEGNLWLWGGEGFDKNGDGGLLNDLWQYDILSEEWTWVSGADTTRQDGNYGSKGTPSATNVPGGRKNAIAWTGPEGDLWLMGGYGNGAPGAYGELNDLWRYDISSGEWTWMSGSDTENQTGNYGTKWIPSSFNSPGARQEAVSWVGPGGNLWLMGGRGYGSNHPGDLNDLWRYNTYSGNWTWMGGSFMVNQPGSYGTKGIASFSNSPGARFDAVAWTGTDGFLWISGGFGDDAEGNGGRLNDLWQLVSNPGALSLDGSSDYGRIADADELDVSSEITLETWVKFNDVDRSGPGQDYMALVMKGSFGDAYGLMLNTGNTNKTLTFYHNGATSGGIGNTTYDWTGISADKWYHVAATFDGSASKIFIDGAEKTSTTASGSITATTDSLFIGQNGGSNKYRLDGSMAEVHLWSKALTHQEIQDQMNLSLSGTEPGLAGAWLPRTGGRHGTVDQTGNGNNMVNVSAGYSADFPPVKVSITGNEGWRFLAAPSDTTSYGTLLDPLWTQGYSGADDNGGSSNVYYYDEIKRSWQTPASSTNVVGTGSDSGDGTGKGALVYVYADDDNDGSNDPFPKTLVLDDFGKVPPIHIPLSYTDTGIYGNDGWHLVANPYPVAIYWQKIVGDAANSNMLDYAYIWDHSLNGGAGGYQIHYGQPQPPALPGEETFDGRIPAFQSFWVKAEGQNASLKLTADHHISNTELYKQSTTSFPFLKISLKGQDYEDGVSLMFPSDKSDAMDPVPKLNSLSQNYAQLYLTDDKDQRWVAQNFIPDKSSQTWDVPMELDATMGGIYSLSWDLETLPKNWKVTLEDNKTGEQVNLRSTNFYDIHIKQEGNQSVAKTLTEKLPGAPGTQNTSKVDEPRFTLQISIENTQETQIPTQTNLYQNYPNPFNPTTNITYDVPEKSQVRLTLYDMLGRKVKTLVNQERAAGQYSLNFNGQDFASGTYIYRLQVGAKVMTKKMTLIK